MDSLLELKRAYQQTLRLQSQILALIYDEEDFGGSEERGGFASEMGRGENCGASVVLTINEPLPSVKGLTEAVEEHWKAMIHAAIGQAARQGRLPYFEKAFLEIKIVTPKRSNNARLWDVPGYCGVYWNDEQTRREKRPIQRGAVRRSCGSRDGEQNQPQFIEQKNI